MSLTLFASCIQAYTSTFRCEGKMDGTMVLSSVWQHLPYVVITGVPKYFSGTELLVFLSGLSVFR